MFRAFSALTLGSPLREICTAGFTWGGALERGAATNHRITHLVNEKMGARLIDGDLFVFFGKNRQKVKMIFYDGTGVLLINKRLERGKFMNLSDLEHREITEDELDNLLRGGVVRRPIFGQMPLTKLPIGNDLHV